mmetsp:Transcript_36142/g.104107  ORF Transcript_36142/g.104107 Transcript_36142/m.104107 type:complete len:204 (-) Transcript_36142:144-755(-)
MEAPDGLIGGGPRPEENSAWVGQFPEHAHRQGQDGHEHAEQRAKRLQGLAGGIRRRLAEASEAGAQEEERRQNEHPVSPRDAKVGGRELPLRRRQARGPRLSHRSHGVAEHGGNPDRRHEEQTLQGIAGGSAGGLQRPGLPEVIQVAVDVSLDLVEEAASSSAADQARLLDEDLGLRDFGVQRLEQPLLALEEKLHGAPEEQG